MPPVDSVASKGFISYKREDNADFNGVADRLRRDIAGRFQALTGRRLDLFIDRESIGWGEDWRQKIRESVEAATLFLPIITMRYFTSDACREELLTFYSNARQLGVTDLLLPIVLTGSAQINEDDPRDDVKLLARLNYKSIEDAWLEGYESPLWNKTIFEMVRCLETALPAAESRLAELERAAARTQHFDTSQNAEKEGEDSETDVLAVAERFERVKATAEPAMQALVSFFETASSSVTDSDFSSLSTQQQRAQLLQLAGKLRDPSKEFGRLAREFEREVTNADAGLRELITELQGIDHQYARDQLRGLVTSFQGAGIDDEVLRQSEEMVAVLQVFSLMSVNLRKALTPTIGGLRSFRSALDTLRSWETLAEQGS